MITLRVLGVDLPVGITHISTDWEVSTDISFTSTVVISTDDTENLTTKIFEDDLDLGTKYYGRARFLFSSGFTEWGNIDVLMPTDVHETKLNVAMPSLIGTPTLSTVFDVSNHPNSFFEITGTPFSAEGTTTHAVTTWVLESSDGCVLWTSKLDKNNLTSILINAVVLEDNKIYRIKSMYKAANGDESQFGCITIYIGDKNKSMLITEPSVVTLDKSEYLKVIIGDALNTVTTNATVELQIFHNGRNIWAAEGATPYSNPSQPVEYYIQTSTFVNGENYIIGVREEIDGALNDWTYKMFVYKEDTATNINRLDVYDADYIYAESHVSIKCPINTTEFRTTQFLNGDILIYDNEKAIITRFIENVINIEEYVPQLDASIDIVGQVDIQQLNNGLITITTSHATNGTVCRVVDQNYTVLQTITISALYDQFVDGNKSAIINDDEIIIHIGKYLFNINTVTYVVTPLTNTLTVSIDFITRIDNDNILVVYNYTVYKYTISTDSMIQLNDIPTVITDAVGSIYNVAGYSYLRRDNKIVLFTKGESDGVVQYMPSTDTWSYVDGWIGGKAGIELLDGRFIAIDIETNNGSAVHS